MGLPAGLVGAPGTSNGGGNMDIADFSASSVPITASLSGAGAPVFDVDDGTPETLHGLEVLIGSAHDDTLIVGALDASAAATVDHVDLGGGFDTIGIAATGTARIEGDAGALRLAGGASFAFANVERIEGGADGLFVYGSALQAHYAAGAGVNYLEGAGAGTILESGAGDSWLVARDGATIVSGAGDDLIDADGAGPVTIVFGRGSGHDMLGSHFSGRMLQAADPGGLPWLEMREALRDRLGDTIQLDGLAATDLELIWEWEEHLAPLYVLGFDDPVTIRIGPAAIRITDTGETLHLGTLAGAWLDGEFCIVLIGSSEYDIVLDFRDGEGAAFAAFAVDYDLFQLGSVHYSLLDLFTPETLVSTALDPAWSAAEDLLGRLGSEAGAIAGTPDSDSLSGTAGSDDMFGGAGDDYFEDGEGDDFVRGGSGWDVFTAGAGDDDIDGGDGTDSVYYGDATLPVTVDLEAGTAASAEFGTDRLAGIEDATGGAGDDSLAGTAAANLLAGGSGDDLLVGRGGDDAYLYNRSWSNGVGWIGDAGDDVIEDSGGYDRLALHWITADEVTASLAPDDSYLLSFAGGGSITIKSGALPAGAIEQVWFADGDWWTGDILTAIANPVVETFGTAGADTLAGTDLRRNRLVGLDGDDVIEGRGGPDVLEGGDGDDLLVGGQGPDLLTGGGGADLFRFGYVEGGHDRRPDRVADFAPGVDRIDLGEMDADLGQSGRQSFTFIGTAAFSGTPGEVRVETRDGDTWLLIDGYGSGSSSIEIVLTGTLAIAAADFIL